MTIISNLMMFIDTRKNLIFNLASSSFFKNIYAYLFIYWWIALYQRFFLWIFMTKIEGKFQKFQNSIFFHWVEIIKTLCRIRKFIIFTIKTCWLFPTWKTFWLKHFETFFMSDANFIALEVFEIVILEILVLLNLVLLSI